MQISLAAAPGSADAFVKLLIAFIKAPEYDFGTDFLKKIKTWAHQAQPFLDQFQIARVFKKPIALMAEGHDIGDQKYSLVLDACFTKLKEKKKAFEKDTSLTKAQLSMLNDIRLARNGSESANKRLMQNAGSFRDSHISKMFLHEG